MSAGGQAGYAQIMKIDRNSTNGLNRVGMHGHAVDSGERNHLADGLNRPCFIIRKHERRQSRLTAHQTANKGGVNHAPIIDGHAIHGETR